MPGEKNYSRNVMQDAQLAAFEKELERKDMSLEDYMKQVRTHGTLWIRGQHNRPICPLHTLRTCAWNAWNRPGGGEVC